MKHYSIIFSTAILALLAACAKENNNAVPQPSGFRPETPIFSAGLDNAGARVGIDANGKFFWNADDSISVFTSTFNWKYTFDGKDGARDGNFIPEDIDGFIVAEPLDPDVTYAVYPHRMEYSYFTYENGKQFGPRYGTLIDPDGTLTVELPTMQQYTAGSFDPKSNTMVAATKNREDRYLGFKNVCGYLCIPVKGTGSVRQLVLHSLNAESISGYARVKASASSAPEILGFVQDNELYYPQYTNNEITIDCPEPVQLSEDRVTEFCFVVPPVKMTGGFSVIFRYADGEEMAVKTTRERTVVRGAITRMQPITAPHITWSNLCRGSFSSQTLSQKLGLGTYEDIVLQKCSIEGEYRIKDAYGTGYDIPFSIASDLLTDDEGDRYYLIRVGTLATPFEYNSYGAVSARDVATWQGDDEYLQNSWFYPDLGYVQIYMSYFVTAGTLGYGLDKFIPYDPPATNDQGISLNNTSETLQLGQTLTLVATITDASISGPVSWSSSDASVASVDNVGNVKALKAGTAVITAEASGKRAQCTITVTATGLEDPQPGETWTW
ncbi:MAG: Ig domain-containing protein [Bacteroidales bacterium]|nr:Ig domain-containing protein [Bacteroidales bacterium]